MNKDHIITYTKAKFSPLMATEDNIDIKDIAHALSLMCRANGHIKHFYSIAQHSINCAAEAAARGFSEKVQLACLLHDASEAYLSDITRPIKRNLPQYLEFEDALEKKIFKKFKISDLTKSEQQQIRDIDDALLYHEFLALMDEKIFENEPELTGDLGFNRRDCSQVENHFLNTYKRLTGQHKSGLSVGIDGCKGKWIAVAIHDQGFEVNKFETIEMICDRYHNASSVIIDIPIGLPESKTDMRPDRIIKKLLGKKGASIFETPCRQAIYSSCKNTAREENIKALGKSLSEQSLAIRNAIHQADHFLHVKSDWKNRLLESHPEYCFMILNDNKPILEKKTEQVGQEKRIELLKRYYPQAQLVIDQFLNDVPSRRKIDDVIDAMCLAIVGAIGMNNGFKTIPEVPDVDSRGIKMQMVIPNL